MTTADIKALMPFIIMLSAIVVVMLTIAFRRSHRLTAVLTLAGLAIAAAWLPAAWGAAPRGVSELIHIDGFSLYFSGLIFAASFTVAALSYSYNENREGTPDEYYLLILSAALGTAVLAASTHFASFFLGLEILSVSLYALAAYQRHSDRSIEAGVKYLILAAVSSAFILFGMALVYAATGAMQFFLIASRAPASGPAGAVFAAGLIMIITGLGFKLAVVPFHFWTPDVYEGAPAPVTAFIATVSKGGVFALILRLFANLDPAGDAAIRIILTIIAVASMFAGNLLALLQTNVKRILAYSSIAHMGYLLVTLLATGPFNRVAAAYYLAAYFVTTLGALGVVTVLSGKERDADDLAEYAGLAGKRPWLAAVFTAMLFSLAGIPLTAGFIAKFYVAAAGVGSSLWFLVIVLVINSALGLFYYLRIIAALYGSTAQETADRMPVPASGGAVLAVLSALLLWLGVYPGPFIALLEKTVQGLP